MSRPLFRAFRWFVALMLAGAGLLLAGCPPTSPPVDGTPLDDEFLVDEQVSTKAVPVGGQMELSGGGSIALPKGSASGAEVTVAAGSLIPEASQSFQQWNPDVSIVGAVLGITLRADAQAPQYVIVRLPAPDENSRILVAAEVDEETEELTWIPVRGTYDPNTGLLTAAVGLGLFQPVEENGVATQKSIPVFQGAGSTAYNGHVGVGVGGQQFTAQIVFTAVEPIAPLEVPFQGPPIPVRALLGARLSNITDPPLDTLTVSSPFGPRTHPVTGVRNKPHKGVDYPVAAGTTVYAAGDGEATVVQWQEANDHGAGAGFYVTIDHGNGEVTRYFHLTDPGQGQPGGCTDLGVCVGTDDNPTRVSAGQPIASSDTTGRVTGAHLHFEVLQNGVPVDPQVIISGTVTATIAMALDYEVQAGTEQQIPLTRREVITPEEMTEYVSIVELTDVAPGEHRLQFVIVEPSGTLEVLADVALTVGEPFLGLSGAELTFTDVTRDLGNGTQYDTGRLESVYSLLAIDDSRLQGQAHITYSRLLEESIPLSSCPMLTNSYGPVEWDAFLEGTYQIQTDGSIYVSFTATPPNGPDYTFTSTNPGCSHLDESSMHPGVNWSGSSAVLVNGRYDYRVDNPLGSGVSGDEYYEVHMVWTTPP